MKIDRDRVALELTYAQQRAVDSTGFQGQGRNAIADLGDYELEQLTELFLALLTEDRNAR